MIVLDASVIIAVLDSTDFHHDRAVELIETHITAGFTVHPLTLAEVLVGPVRAGRAHQLVSDLNDIGIRPHQSLPDEPLIIAELRATTGLKMPDCCVLAVATDTAASLATFDEQLARVSRQLNVPTLP